MGDTVSLAGLKQRPNYLAGQKKNQVEITGGTLSNVVINNATLNGVDGITFDTPIPIVSGGTGAGDASTARANLGLAIGTNVQAYDSDLTAFSAKTAPSGAVVGTTDAQTLTNKTITAPLGIVKGDVGLGNVENTALSTWPGSTNLVTLGTVTSGTWQGTLVNSTYGGTGVNNGGRTITYAGNVTHAGAFTQTFTATGNSAITIPTTGTLATLSNTETLSGKTLTSPIISTIVNTGTITLPTATDTLLGRATTDTLTNKTITDFINTGSKICLGDTSKTSDITFGNVNNLSVNVGVGQYILDANLLATAGAGGGIKVAIGGTATFSFVNINAINYNGTTINANTTATAAGAAAGAATAVTTNIVMRGSIITSAAGALTIQFAQNVSNATPTTVQFGSQLFVSRVS